MRTLFLTLIAAPFLLCCSNPAVEKTTPKRENPAKKEYSQWWKIDSGELSFKDVKPLVESKENGETIFTLPNSEKLIFHHGTRDNEYFQPKDTTDRDYFILNDFRVYADVLSGMRITSEYTGSYDCLYLYALEMDQTKFIVVFFVDGNHYGTDSRISIGILTSTEKGHWAIQSKYLSKSDVLDHEKIKIKAEGDKITLISEEIEEIETLR